MLDFKSDSGDEMEQNIYLDTAATLGYTYFEPKISMNYHNPNAIYEDKDSDEAIKMFNSVMIDALNLPGGIICLTNSASHSAEIIYKIFKGRVCCWDSAHDSIYSLCDWDGRGEGEYLDVFTPVNNVTGCYENNMVSEDIKFRDEFIGYDCTATLGRRYCDSKFWEDVDCAWGSGHKFGTPIGIGWLWLSDRLCERFGFASSTKNNWGVFHGTMSLPNYECLTSAIKYAQDMAKLDSDKYVSCDMRADIFRALEKANIDYDCIGQYEPDDGIQSIVCLRIIGVNANILVNMLAQKHIYISPGASACSFEAKGNRVLEYYGCNKSEECIRISVDPYLTVAAQQQLVGCFVEKLVETINFIKGV